MITDLSEVIERVARSICDTRNYPGRYDQLSHGNALAQQKWLEAAKVALSILRPRDRVAEGLVVMSVPKESVCEGDHE